MSGQMNKKDLSETDIRTKFITPAIVKAGWNPMTQLREEYAVTKGRIIARGKICKREKPLKADYVLFYKPNKPIAVVEAKDNNHTMTDGMQQALQYAKMMDIPFVFSSNGDGFVFHNKFTTEGDVEITLSNEEFPSPETLWQLYHEQSHISPQQDKVIDEPYYSDNPDKQPRYYQMNAVNRTVESIANGENRVLLVMATGTGKTYMAFQIIWRLWKAGIKKRILFLADRRALVSQPMTDDFAPFKDHMTWVTKTNFDTAHEIYLALYQGLSGEDEGDNSLFRQFSPGFFDLVVVDECHRGSAKVDSQWREVLNYFESATQIGLTATPKETTAVSNIDYFGDPIYTYSLKQGIKDGFLAPYRVIRVFFDKHIRYGGVGMTAQDLKNSILQMAMQGKLVPQDPNDKPASQLLKHIKAEKARLIVEGRIKKEKPLPPITEDEIPFDIPETWEWVRLGDLCIDLFSGKSPVYSKVSTPYKVIGQAANQEGGIDLSQTKYTVESFWSSMEDRYFLQVGDVLLNTLGNGTLGRSGIVNSLDDNLLTDGHLFVFRQLDMLTGKFLLFYFQSIRKSIEKGANGSTNQTFLSLTKTQKWIIPVPPLAEQQRIVAKIEELLPHIMEYDIAEKRLTSRNAEFPDKLRKSILQQAVQGKLTERDSADEPASELLNRIRTEKARLIAEGKIKKEKNFPLIIEDELSLDIPETWEWASIAETCTNIQYGTSNKSSESGKVAVLRMGNLQGGKIDYESLVYTSNNYDIERCHLEYNDLLFNRTNSKELVGKTAIYKAEMPAIYAGYLIRITPIEIDCDYLNYVMQSYYFKQYCQSVKTDAIGQSNINAEKLKRFIFPIPPLAEQQRIVARVEELLAVCDKLK